MGAPFIFEEITMAKESEKRICSADAVGGRILGVSTAIKFEEGITFEQIRLCKERTNVGDDIQFEKDIYCNQIPIKIYGTVKKKYKHLFLLEDGRSFTWVEYLVGNPRLAKELRNQIDYEAKQGYSYTDPTIYITCKGPFIQGRVNKRGIIENRSSDLFSKFTMDQLSKIRNEIKRV